MLQALAGGNILDHIFKFGDKGNNIDKEVMGNKGSNLIKLYQNGINVPDGFIISNALCRTFLESDDTVIQSKMKEIKKAINQLEKSSNTKLGDPHQPLILSIRSGASVSMPGMLSTILNFGITNETVEASKKMYLYESYINFLDSFSKCVYHVDLELNGNFDKNINTYNDIIKKKKELFYDQMGMCFEDNVWRNLEKAIEAVCHSWNNHNAIAYRKIQNIPDGLGTAIIIQEMKFGNFSANSSGSGIVFTKNPLTGDDELYGEYLPGEQGECLVSGLKNPKLIDLLKIENPSIYEQLVDQIQKIKSLFTKPQDIEFTYENDKLYILQTRDIKI